MAIHPKVVIPVLCLCASVAYARPGDLDPTFSGDGRLTISAGTGLSIVQQADDKLVLLADDGSGDLTIARLGTDGTADASFGTSGVAVIDMGGVDDVPNVLVHQLDGMLVAGGTSDGDIVLVRVDGNGDPDPGFDTDGTLVVDLGNSDDALAGMLQQPDGKLVIAASSGGNLVFARFNADGSPDAGFGTAGKTSVDFGAALIASGLALAPDGKLIAIGIDATIAPGARFNVVRVTDTGTPDSTFDTDGLASVTFTGPEAAATGVAVQADGKIVVVGYVVSTANAATLAPTGTIVRLTDVGVPDTTFSTDGIASVDAGNFAIPYAVVVQPDTKILVAGVHGPDITADGALPAPTDIFVSRFNATGIVTDNSFGQAGTTVADFGEADQAPASVGRAMVLQGDGGIVVTGESNGEIAVARFADATSPGLVGMTVTSATTAEGGTLTITVRRTGGVAGAASVDWTTTAGTAQAGSDFTPASGTFNWDVNTANFNQIIITTLDDAAVESDENFTVTLSNPVGVALAASEATLTVTSDDAGAAGTVGFAAATQSVAEDAGPVSIRVSRTGGSTGAVSVQYTTAPGTAGVSDYTPATGTLNWADGDSADQFIDVDIDDDSTDESNENFTVTLSAPTGGATLGTDDTAITITDDDASGGGGGGGGGGALGLGELAVLMALAAARARRRPGLRA